MIARKKHGDVRNFIRYFLHIIKFYDIKGNGVAPVLFVLMLGLNSVSIFLTSKVPLDKLLSKKVFDTATFKSFGWIYLIEFLIMLLSAIYLTFYIKDLKEEPYTNKQCLIHFFRNLLKVIGGYILYAILMGIGILALFIPFFFIAITCIFHTCLILDKGFGVVSSLRESDRIIKGKRMKVLWLIVIVMLLFEFPAGMGYDATLVGMFITAFFTTIVKFMKTRLIALMYMDLAYGVAEDIEYEDAS